MNGRRGPWTPEDSPDLRPVGSLVYTFDEYDDLPRLPEEIARDHAGIIDQEEDFGAFLGEIYSVLGSQRQSETWTEPDWSESFLVVTGYHKCTERSSVWADPERDPTLLWVELDGDREILCYAAPLHH